MWCICSDMVSATAIITMVIRFCRTMNTRLKTIRVWWANVPRTTSIGSALDNTTAGTTPATAPSSRAKSNTPPMLSGVSASASSNLVSSNCEKNGAKAAANNTLSTNDKRQSMMLSDISLLTMPLRWLPRSLRIAISRDRRPACATVRLI